MIDTTAAAFAIICLLILGAFLVLACLIMGILISIGISQYMERGWSFFESFKKSLGEWK